MSLCLFLPHIHTHTHTHTLVMKPSWMCAEIYRRKWGNSTCNRFLKELGIEANRHGGSRQRLVSKGTHMWEWPCFRVKVLRQSEASLTAEKRKQASFIP